MECGICREDKESTKWFGSWENYVCAECDQVMDEGYKECFPDEAPNCDQCTLKDDPLCENYNC